MFDINIQIKRTFKPCKTSGMVLSEKSSENTNNALKDNTNKEISGKNLLQAILAMHSGQIKNRNISFGRNFSKEELIKYIRELKDKNGEPRWQNFEIPTLLEIVNNENFDIFKQISDMTNSKGQPKCGIFDLIEILKEVNHKNFDIFKRISNIKDFEGGSRFMNYQIIKLLKIVNSENFGILERISGMTDKQGKTRFQSHSIPDLLKAINSKNYDIFEEIAQLTNNKGFKRFNGQQIETIMEKITPENKNFLYELISLKEPGALNLERLDRFEITQAFKMFSNMEEFNAADNIIKEQKKKVLEHPEMYVNGEFSSPLEMHDQVLMFFAENYSKLLVATSVFDKDIFNNLLRMRFEEAWEYLENLGNLNTEETELLSKMCKSKNTSGKPFLSNQQIEFIDLIYAYKQNRLPLDKMQAMADSGTVDIGKLNFDLFQQIMKNSGLTDEQISQIPMEKLMAWNKKYIHLLSKEIISKNSRSDTGFMDILKAANLEPDFEKFIHDPSNIYGKTNEKTKEAFRQSWLDYERWLHPSKEIEVKFKTQDKNMEKLNQITTQLTEDIETLRENHFIRKIIDKQFPKCIKGNQFILPVEILSSKARLTEFTQNLIKQLNGIWDTAKAGLENPQRETKARNTLTILDHLNQRISDIATVSDNGNAKKTLDYTIKMWDRNPQKDIFQGNYSTCCIAMGGGNGSAMPHYLMNSAYNMIEIVDNKSGKTIGNALCYFVKNTDNKPMFIIDNIEINNAVKPSEEIGLKLRDAITEYASKVAEDVTGSDDIPVCMSGSYNDVPCNDLPIRTEQVSFLGDIDCDQIYMDLYKGWVEKNKLAGTVNLLKLK